VKHKLKTKAASTDVTATPVKHRSAGSKPRVAKKRKGSVTAQTPSKENAQRAAGMADDSRARFPIVGVGASAGGLEAFTQLLKHLPADTGMGFVLVQHLDPQHESALVHLLSRATTMPVREVTDRMRVEPNRVYVIPRDKLMVIVSGALRLQPRTKGRVPTRSIDFIF